MAVTKKKYIAYRKIKALLNRIVFYIMRIFPVDNNLVSVCTFEGKGGFGCNPKYVVQELHKRHPQYKFIWMLNDEAREKKFPDYIKKVNNSMLLTRAYWLSRSKVWIDNYRKPYGTVKRKNQLYINVNHYNVGIKATGLLRGDKFSEIAYLVSKNDSDMIDELVIDSYWSESCFNKALIYDGRMLKIGSPRCDVLYGQRKIKKEKFKRAYNLPENSKIAMFAPTFREKSDNGLRSVYSSVWTIDFKRLISCLEQRTGNEWYICIRVHPQLAGEFKGYQNSNIENRIIDLSTNDDMYEILAAMDIYITDYSSAVFEAGYAGIPAFIYADDIDKYKYTRELMWDFDTKNTKHILNNKKLTPKLELVFPFSVSQNNDELEKNITQFDLDEYLKQISEFKHKIGLIFDGKASSRLCEYISNVIDR